VVQFEVTGDTLADFAKNKKVVSFYGGENSILKPAFFQSLGILPDVERLLLSRCEEGGAFAEMANAFPNATSIDLSDVGLFGKLPVFPKAKKFSTDAEFDDTGLSFLAKMPEAHDDFILAETITEAGLEAFASALSPEARSKKCFVFSRIGDTGQRHALIRKAKSLGLPVLEPQEGEQKEEIAPAENKPCQNNKPR
jgi:hypothetical protein